MGSLRETIVSFFKVMIDEDFLRVLYLPPKFTRIAPELLKNTKTYLQDLSERKWNVAVSKENGSFAIKKGWSDFGKAHNLEIGDIVVFHYFPGRYFTVQIFNRSACDVRDFSVGIGIGRTRKRKRPEVIPADKYGKSAGKWELSGNQDLNDSVISASDRGNGRLRKNEKAIEVHPLAFAPTESNKKGKCEPADFEDADIQFLMIDRNRADEKREERAVIDLSNYEMPSAEAKSSIQRAANGPPFPYDGALVKHKSEPGSTEVGNYDLPSADVESSDQRAANRPQSPYAGTLVKSKAEPGSKEVASIKQELKSDVGLPEPAKQVATERSLLSDVKLEVSDTSTMGTPSRITTSFPKYDTKSDVVKFSTPKPGHDAKIRDAPSRNGIAVVKIKNEPNTETFEEGVIDLSNYKMPAGGVKSRKQRAGNASSAPYAGALVKCKAEPGSAEAANVKQEMKCDVGLPEPEKQMEIRKSWYSDVKRKVYGTTGTPGHMAPLFPKCDTKSEVLTMKSGYETKIPHAPSQRGNALVKIKKEPQTEPFEESGSALVTTSASDLHCPITNTSSLLLELPASLPLFRSTSGTSDTKLVILRDAASRVWPVHYYHKPSMKILMTGWSAFAKANKVQLGDECIFKVVPEEDATYDVSIVRKGGRPT